ncbi:type 1 glutamine amidotransferase [Roseobacteraceae bacterium S113]
MHLALLMTNTDESAFAQAHPKDGVKFSALVHTARPDWHVSVFAVKDGVFPTDITAFDGIIITGSPASVHDAAPWVARLLDEIARAYHAGMPMFGACFGHQAIAKALGGSVVPNPDGWAFGLQEMRIEQTPDWLAQAGVADGALLQYGAHIEQVAKMPAGAQVLFSMDHCPNAGFAISDQVFTTQNHPEMTPAFAGALVEEYAEKLGPGVAARARASLGRTPDYAAFSEAIARFFEQAQRA